MSRHRLWLLLAPFVPIVFVVFFGLLFIAIDSELRQHCFQLSLRSLEAGLDYFAVNIPSFLLGWIALPVLYYCGQTAVKWYKNRQTGASYPLRKAAADSFMGGVVVFFLTVSVGAAIFGVFIVKTVHETCHVLRNERDEAMRKNVTLEESLRQKKHSIDTTDAVFPNIIYLLQAFRMYRVALGHDAQCTVYITAPPDSVPTASAVAQFSIATSNCATFGPLGSDLPPTLEKETLGGSVPGMVIVHAPENNRAADELMNRLTSVFRVKRGYKSIPTGRLANSVPPDYIWLQFGVNTRFASELRENEARVKQK